MSGVAHAIVRSLLTAGATTGLFALLAPGFVLSLPPNVKPKDPNRPKWDEYPLVPPKDPNNIKYYENMPNGLNSVLFTRRVTAISVLVHSILFLMLSFMVVIVIAWLYDRAFD